jgi:hypothetical protein
MTEGPVRLLVGPMGRVVLVVGLVICAATRFLYRLFS